jgi:hypothetical protein
MDGSVSDGATFTVVAIADGNASIYLSSGGGFIGGVAHDSIRNAATAMVDLAKRSQPTMTATKSYPLPKCGETTFYVLTDVGVFTASASEQALREHRHPLSPLFYAGQQIVTQYRLLSKGKK